MKILLSVTNDLVTDQRVHRACMALHQAGHHVTLIGRRLPHSPQIIRPYHTVRMRLLFRKKALFYAEYNLRLLLRLLLSRADLFYANDTDTLLANYLAARLRRKPMLFDAHELFPEVPELVGRPRVKAFWQHIEDLILPRIARRNDMAAITVCHSIADIYHHRYGLHMDVVRNVPIQPSAAACDLVEHGTPAELDEATLKLSTLKRAGKRLLLYQGAVNVGRGIDWVMHAMPLLPQCHFIVAGDGDEYHNLLALKEKMQLHNVTFLGRLTPDQLRQLTPLADLGISLLENRGLNYYYSLPNRLADFAAAHVPVLATDFPEIRRLIQRYHIGQLLPPAPFDTTKQQSQPPDPHLLADAIRNTLALWDSLPTDERNRRFLLATADLNWDNDKNTLLKNIDAIKKTKHRFR